MLLVSAFSVRFPMARRMDEFIENLPPMDLMRSEKMTYIQLIIPVETAHRAVSYLGELGLLQFHDVSCPYALCCLRDSIRNGGAIWDLYVNSPSGNEELVINSVIS